MGTYTPNLNFYKPDFSEFVDPDTQLNRNWDIADAAVKRLLEYEFSPIAFPDGSTSPSARSKYYREPSNSIVQYVKSTATWNQDSAARVSPWTHLSGTLAEGYFEQPSLPIYYRFIRKSVGATTEIEWAGAIWELGGAMELNTNVAAVPVGGIPTSLRPVTNKYFTVFGGNTTTDFSIARILFGSDGRLEFKRYGVNPGTNTSENRIELTGIKYNLEVTGT